MANTYNRLGNCHNRFQTEVPRVLCLCSAGLLRAPTMANVLHATYGFNTRAAGVTQEYALIPIDPVLIEWADVILAASPEVHASLTYYIETSNDIDTEGKIIEHLDVPDRYEWNHPELRRIIAEQTAELAARIDPKGTIFRVRN